MSDELIKQLSARLDEMSKRIDQLQDKVDAPKPKKPWYKPSTPGEIITVIGIPAALIGALWTFYDGFWLKVQRLDAATTAVAQDRLTELQELREEIFVLQTRDKDAEISAILEAKDSRSDRLVQESYVYWQQQPKYFTNKETLLLVQELQLQNRQGDALDVIETVKANGLIEVTDLERLRGSLFGAEGPAQDLEAARAAYKLALQTADRHASEAGKEQLFAKVTYSWLFTELSNNTGCDASTPVAEALSSILEDDEDAFNLGVLDPEARMLLEIQKDRCG